MRIAERIMGAPLPPITELYRKHVICHANSVATEPSHPSHTPLPRLPSGKKFWIMGTVTSRQHGSFIPQAVKLLNTLLLPKVQIYPHLSPPNLKDCHCSYLPSKDAAICCFVCFLSHMCTFFIFTHCTFPLHLTQAQNQT